MKLSIPLRAAIITGIVPGQDARGAATVLESLGVPADRISTDRVRAFGRGTIADPSQACGHCGHAVAAVLPDGRVAPCPMTRWLTAGSVYDKPLGTILGEAMTAVSAVLLAAGASCNPKCLPDSYCDPLCTPGACKPRI